MATSWFKYNGGSTSSPGNYSIITVTNCPEPNTNLCAVFAEIQIIDGVQRPILSPALQSEIATALGFGVESANVLLQP